MMNKWILVCGAFLLWSGSVAASSPLSVIVYDIYDGDTFRIDLPLPPPLNRAYIRIKGIDTPEKGSRAKCSEEKAKAEEALVAIKELIPINSSVTLTNYDWDKYGGRINAFVESNGINVGEELIKRNLAVPYTGQGPKKDWCTAN